MNRKIILLLSFFIFSNVLSAQTNRQANEDFERGLIQIQLLDYEAAKESFTKAIKNNPNDGNAYYNRGVVLHKLGSKDSACRDWNFASLVCDTEAIGLINLHCDSTYSIVKQMPAFPGGEEAFIHYLQKNIVYPDSAWKARVSGTVFLSFVVKYTGEIVKIKVLQGKGAGLDEEAIRVLSQMPQWSPGMLCGKPVNVLYNCPIRFSR